MPPCRDNAFYISVAAIVLLVSLASRSNVGAAEPYKSGPGPFAVELVDETWHDEKRDRDLPIRLYVPSKTPAPGPVLLFSHGLGGSREACSYLGRHWASHGYLVVFLQHPGSDIDLLAKKGRFRTFRLWRAGRDPEIWKQRPQDVSFALDELERRHQNGLKLRGRVDANRFGIAGHSFGAFTVLASIGLLVDLPNADDTSFRDERIKAAVAMSSPPTLSGALDAQSADGIATSCLYLNGTKDDLRGFRTLAKDRRVHFDRTTKAEAWLATFQDAEQFAFTEVKEFAGRTFERDPRHHDWIRQLTIAFFDVQLMQDPRAIVWLNEGGFAGVVGDGAKLEHKVIATSKK
jgi:predicted dienelactone hydrolase